MENLFDLSRKVRQDNSRFLCGVFLCVAFYCKNLCGGIIWELENFFSKNFSREFPFW